MSVFHVARNLGLKKDDCILDIGANIGHASIPICKKLSCNLIAVEASKENASLLLRNINLNNIKAEVLYLHLCHQNSRQNIPNYI